MESTFTSENTILFRSSGSSLQLPERRVRSVALWDVTKKCNLRCIHCYNYDKYLATTHTSDKETTTSEALSIIDKLADSNFDQIHFLGGEPLYRDDILHLFSHAVSRGIAISINSNGICLTDEMMKRLIDVGVSQLAISLDGSDSESNDFIRGRGSFQRITENLKTAALVKVQYNSDMQLGVVTTLTRPLLEKPGKVGAFFPLLDDLGINWLNFIFLYKNSKALSQADILSYPMSMALEALETEGVAGMREYPNIYVQLDCRPLFGKYLNRKYGVFTHVHHYAIKCSAGHKTWLIEADGQVHPCGLCSSPDYGLSAAEHGCFVYDPPNMIDIQEGSQVYKSEYFHSVRKYLRSKKNYEKFTMCKSCEYYGKTCLPCPLYSTDGPVHELKTCRVEECEWTIDKLENFYRNHELTVPQLISTDIVTEQQESMGLRIKTKNLETSFKLTGTGKNIWQWIDSELTVSNLVDRLADSYRNPPDRSTLRRDVVDFLCRLRDAKILTLKEV